MLYGHLAFVAVEDEEQEYQLWKRIDGGERKEGHVLHFREEMKKCSGLPCQFSTA